MIKYITLFYAAIFFHSNAVAQDDLSYNKKIIDTENFENSTGIGIGFTYKGEVFSNLSGGYDKKSVYLDNFDLVFDFDLGHIFNWNGARVNFYILGNHGGDPSEYAGAAQGISNIASFQTWKLYQFWLEQNFLNDNLSFLFGLYDLNSEFDTRETSSIFINPSHGIGPDFSLTGKNGPSIFPTTSLAFRTSYNISENFNIKTAVFDGVPGDPNTPGGTHILFHSDDGVLLAGELTYHSESKELVPGYYKLSVGAWTYTDSFDKLNKFDTDGNPVMQNGNAGAYISAEKFLFSEPGSGSEGLSAFVRLGIADHEVNQVHHYLGAGIHYTGIIPGRENDVIGLAVASIANSDNYINLLADQDYKADKYEHIFELTYILKLNDWLNIQPDFQYVINPVNCNLNKSAFIYGTRVELAL
jgi:porin